MKLEESVLLALLCVPVRFRKEAELGAGILWVFSRPETYPERTLSRRLFTQSLPSGENGSLDTAAVFVHIDSIIKKDKYILLRNNLESSG
jgi:hypothetical protein